MNQGATAKDEATVFDRARRGSNQSGMRAYNERIVLSLIRQFGGMAKAEIARRTGLSAQTVSVIIRALEADGLLVRGDPVRGKIGQPSIPMHLAANGAFFFGLKVGRRSLDMVLTDFVGRVQHRVRKNNPLPTPDDTVQFAGDAIKEILGQLPNAHKARIAGLGIALPFQLWDWADDRNAKPTRMDSWKDRDIAAELGAQWDLPVFVCNDASTACGAELVFGDQNKPDDFLYFFVGSFIGGGLVLDNSLYTGPSGNAAALGSLRVQMDDGSICQLVDVASLAVLETALADSGNRYSMIWDDPDSWSIPERQLDTWLTHSSQAIAMAIASSICLIDVGHVLIDGWMPQSMRADLVRRTERALADLPVPGVQKPAVMAGTIGPDARALGAASLPLSNRFLADRNSFQKGPAA